MMKSPDGLSNLDKGISTSNLFFPYFNGGPVPNDLTMCSKETSPISIKTDRSVSPSDDSELHSINDHFLPNKKLKIGEIA